MLDLPDGHVFLLQVRKYRHNQLRVDLIQRIDGKRESRDEDVVAIWGLPLEYAQPQLIDALRHKRLPPSTLNRPQEQPVELAERDGVRLSVLLMALKPLRKGKRMERIYEQVIEMSDEEAAYWFAKLRHSDAPRRAARALRILLAAE